MATVRRLDGDRWEVRWYERSPDGPARQRSKTIRARSERDARSQAALLEVDQRRRSSQFLVSHAVAELVRHGGRRTAKSNSEVETRARLHIIPGIGDVPVSELTAKRLERFYAELEEKGLASGTIRHVHSDVHQALRLAKRDGWIDANVAEDVMLGRLERRMVVPPTLEQLRQLIDWALEDAERQRDRRGNHWGALELVLFLRLAAVTGGRLGEVLALRYDDLAGGQARISRAVEVHRGRVRIKSTKTRNHRSVPIPIEMVELVAEHHRRAEEHLGLTVTTDGLIFLSTDNPLGAPLRPGTMQSRYNRLAARHGVEFSPHDLRHFAASSWLKLLPAIEASTLAGHSRTSTTTDIYGHLLDSSDDGTIASILAPVLRRGTA